MDFWELTGGLRVDILRRSPSGGDPEKMIPPETAITIIPAVRAIVIASDVGSVTDRAGELALGEMKLELIDPVHDSDRLRVHGVEHEIGGLEQRDLGSFRRWVVHLRRVE
jgi:hypothetical protein